MNPSLELGRNRVQNVAPETVFFHSQFQLLIHPYIWANVIKSRPIGVYAVNPNQ